MNPLHISLNVIEIASPCHVSWDEMSGDDRARYCGQCKQNVYDISQMSRQEAEAFVNGREGGACMRFYRRHDGTILTRDCPVGLRAVRQRFVRAVAALVGLVAALVTGTLFGGRLSRVQPEGFQPPAQAFAEWSEPGSTQPMTFSMGFFCVPAEPIAPSSPISRPSSTDN